MISPLSPTLEKKKQKTKFIKEPESIIDPDMPPLSPSPEMKKKQKSSVKFIEVPESIIDPDMPSLSLDKDAESFLFTEIEDMRGIAFERSEPIEYSIQEIFNDCILLDKFGYSNDCIAKIQNCIDHLLMQHENDDLEFQKTLVYYSYYLLEVRWQAITKCPIDLKAAKSILMLIKDSFFQ